jgi:hypothetical protein
MEITIFKEGIITMKTITYMDSHIHINHPNFPNSAIGEIQEQEHLHAKYSAEIPPELHEAFVYEVNVYGYDHPWVVLVKYIEADGTKKESSFLDEGDADEHKYYLGFLTRCHDAFPLGRRNAKLIKYPVN